MTSKLAAEQVRIAALMLPAVDSVLRAMVADAVPDPVRTLRRLLADATGEDAIARRYGAMARAIKVTFTLARGFTHNGIRYRRNGRVVDHAIERCLGIAGALL